MPKFARRNVSSKMVPLDGLDLRYVGMFVLKNGELVGSGTGVEVMKSPYLGANGHIAIRTNSIPRAAAELEKRGFKLDESTAKYKGDKMVAVYLTGEFGGFAIHLLQK